MPTLPADHAALRTYRNSRLYRSLARTLRVYNRMLIDGLHLRGFADFSASFPSILANLDAGGSRIGVLAARAGITRQAAGQLLREIHKCGYVKLDPSPDDARATMVSFTARGRRLLATVLALVEQIEGDFATAMAPGDFEHVRAGLLQIADRLDPGGRLGEGDRSERKKAKGKR
jgi:DNA-binding MarR family transcriptional regulator